MKINPYYSLLVRQSLVLGLCMFAITFSGSTVCFGQELDQVKLNIEDHPGDNGTALKVILQGDQLPWKELEEAEGDVGQLTIMMSEELGGLYREVAAAPPLADPWTYDEQKNEAEVVVESLHRGTDYYFRAFWTPAGGEPLLFAETLEPSQPRRQWFLIEKWELFFVGAVICGSVILFIQLAKRGMPLRVRKIAGLDAVDEAVGRATEMGRSIMFIPGIQDMNDIQTIAGLNILARVARTAAEYEADVEVPTDRSLVMTAARETLQGAYLSAGRPDAYNPDLAYYVTDEQFGFVAYVSGHMVREEPAACFYLGAFYAESLILSETGNLIGAIQVAGTAEPSQLPFFVAACDYTLIGEELFAASAYLSGSPEELGSLKGQDAGKILVAIGILTGCFSMTLGFGFYTVLPFVIGAFAILMALSWKAFFPDPSLT